MPDMISTMNQKDSMATGFVTNDKSVCIGTHRVCPPEETWARVQPFLAKMGITRVAEITHLDSIGIPVYQAIRPNSRNISLAQGKGITKALAKVSAVMEAIETWHAEQPVLPVTRATIGDMAKQLPYSIYDLNVSEHNLIHDALELDWYPAHLLTMSTGGTQQTFIPADYIRLDFTVKNKWLIPLFMVSSNGLASGNTTEEAMLHALYEIVERDTFEQVRRGSIQKIAIDPATVTGDASTLLIEKIQAAGVTLNIFFAQAATGLGCFEVNVISSNCPFLATGYGCHLDSDVALSRALTEAIQSRLTIIAGARDDIGRTAYISIQNRQTVYKAKKKHPSNLADFKNIASTSFPSLIEDLHEVSRRILATVNCPPIVVDLTRQEFNIPVTFLAVPQLHFLESL